MKTKLLTQISTLSLILLVICACSKNDEEPPPPAPFASFTVENNNCIAPCEMTFTNQSQNATSYQWDLGNGETAITADASATYETPGDYVVKLTASSVTEEDDFSITVTAIEDPNPHLGKWNLVQGTYNGSVVDDYTASLTFTSTEDYKASFVKGDCDGRVIKGKYEIANDEISSNLPGQLLLNGISGGGTWSTSISCSQSSFTKYGVVPLIWTPSNNIQFEMDGNSLTLTSSDGKAVLVYEKE